MNYPKNPNDLYLFGGLGLSALGCSVLNWYPVHDWNVNAAFWVSQFWAATCAVRWVGASVWSDVDNARTVLKMRLFKESIPTVENPNPAPVDGFFKVNRPAVIAAKAGMTTNANAVEMPKLNLQKYFFETVLHMYDIDPVRQSKVNMTEARWVTERKIFSQIPFKVMKDKAVECGAFMRKSQKQNAPYIVDDRSILAHLAKGNPLP